ncbi:MAG TPA: YwmB family TATA-box binding protein, partial [Mobilitalea sp.]|nr:YwmB family TATA-box binding protein [Mobilitalea sp.]
TTVLWLAVITQIVVNRIFFKGFEIAEAFVITGTEDIECSLEIVVQHPDEFLSENDKKDIIRYIADAIGLNIDKDIEIIKDNERTEYVFQKQAKKAETALKVVSLVQDIDSEVKMKHYVIARLKIKESIKSLEKYRELLENAFDKLGIDKKQVTVQYEGYITGLMTKESKEAMARQLVNELKGEIAFEYWQNDNYTVYAYTGLIDEFIESAGCKINIQIAMSNDENSKKTKIYLASPIINSGW